MDIMDSEFLTDCSTFNRAADFTMKMWLLVQNVCTPFPCFDTMVWQSSSVGSVNNFLFQYYKETLLNQSQYWYLRNDKMFIQWIYLHSQYCTIQF